MTTLAAVPDEREPCPCGSGSTFGDCCGPLLAGAPAPSAEALMRSRYTAHVLGDAEHLARTCCPGSAAAMHQASIQLDPEVRWLDLRILHTEAGGADDQTGVVEFIARFKRHGRAGRLREMSRFQRLGVGWCYLEGTPDVTHAKPGKRRRRR
jgi:SEC-C motif-containing protein